MDDLEDDDDDDDDEDDDEEPKKKKAKREEPQGKLLTLEELKRWQAFALKGSLYGLKRLAVALRSACRANEAQTKKKRPTKAERAKGEDDEDEMKADRRVGLEPLALGGVRIDSPEVLNSLLFFCIRQMPGIVDRYLGYTYAPPTDDDKNGSGLPKSNKKWRGIEKILTSFAGSILKLLSQITEPKVRVPPTTCAVVCGRVRCDELTNSNYAWYVCYLLK